MIKWGDFTKRKIEVDEVKKYFSKFSGANIAVITGKPSGIVVIDVDNGKVPDFLQKVETWIVKSKRGYHFYFSIDDERFIRTAEIENKIELKGEGSLITIPLSYYPKCDKLGFRYEWLIPPWNSKMKRFNRLADFDEVMSYVFSKYFLRNEEKEIERLASLYEGVEEGKRNIILTRIAGSLFYDGLNEKEVSSVLQIINERNKPPLPHKEVENIVKSLGKKLRDKIQYFKSIENFSCQK